MEENKLKNINTKITIYDVASEANVSLATVSRVLNYPNKVKPSTRERVHDAINKLGYRPNAIARGLASRKSTTVALIVPDVSRASVAEMINGVVDIANKYQYSVMLKVTNNDNEAEKDMWKEVIAAQVDGVLYLNDELTDEHITLIKESPVPVILCNTKDEEMRVPSVSIDFEQAMYEATKHFVEKGKKKILFVSSRRAYSVNAIKEKGYLQAIEEKGLQSYIVRTSGRVPVAYDFFKEYLSENSFDSAVVVRDSIAISVINAASDLGISIPNDFEVIGFQNTNTSKMARPTLSTVDNPIYDIGAVSMRLLTKLMNGEIVDEVNINLPHNIIWRNSTK